jgi:hypothetical protein
VKAVGKKVEESWNLVECEDTEMVAVLICVTDEERREAYVPCVGQRGDQQSG